MFKKCRLYTRYLLCLWVFGVTFYLVYSFPGVFTGVRIPQRSLLNTSNIETPFIKRFRPNDSKRMLNAIQRKQHRTKSPDEFYRLRDRKVNRLSAEFLIDNRRFCETGDPFLLVVIPSLPTHYLTRSTIRKTYGSFKPEAVNGTVPVVKVLFFVGRIDGGPVDQMVRDEMKDYGDIVQADFKEHYQNLTLKMMVILKWVATFCGNLEFMLKIDEDVFVNIPRLMTELHTHPYDRRGNVLGHINVDSSVRRRGKWAVSRDQFPMAVYPTYASGNSYVISGNIIPRMFMASEYIPYMPIEDVFVTGILARIVGANHISVPGFTFWLEDAPDPCSFAKSKRISATKVDRVLMRELWDACTVYEQTCAYKGERENN